MFYENYAVVLDAVEYWTDGYQFKTRSSNRVDGVFRLDGKEVDASSAEKAKKAAEFCRTLAGANYAPGGINLQRKIAYLTMRDSETGTRYGDSLPGDSYEYDINPALFRGKIRGARQSVTPYNKGLIVRLERDDETWYILTMGPALG